MRRKILLVLAVTGELCVLPARVPVLAQSPADTTAAVGAITKALLAELGGEGDHHLPAVFGPNPGSSWTESIRQALRAHDDSSIVATVTASDSAHALYLRIDAVAWRGNQLVMRATWSRCSRRTSMMNWWHHEVRYAFARIPEGWIPASRQITAIGDGHCDPGG